jgi:O-antigen/teichoic acid export membrane protein
VSVQANQGPDSVSRNISFEFVVNLTSAAFSAVLVFYLVRSLGPHGYGVFSLAMSIGLLVLLPANLGIANSTARFMAELRDDRAAVHGLIVDALRLKLISSTIFCLILAAAAGPIANLYHDPALAWPIRILSLAMFGQGMLQLYDQIFEAEGRIALYLRVITAQSAIELVASVGLVLAGLGVSGAMAGRAGAYLFAAGFGFLLVARTFEIAPGTIHRGHGNVRRIGGYASALVIIDGAFTLFTRIDVLLIGAIIGTVAVGEFEGAMRLVTMTTYAGAAVASGVGPRVARGVAGPDTAMFDRALRKLMALQGVFIAPFLIWAEPLCRIALGPDYTEAHDVVRILTPFVFMLAISPVLARGVTYMGEARLRIPIAIGTLLINLFIDLLLLSKIGIVAGAIGTDVAYTLYVAAHLWICRRLIGTELRPLARTFAAVLFASACMVAVLLAFGTGNIGLVPVLIGGTIGVAVYIAALLVVREVTKGDLDAVRHRLVSMAPGRPRRA